MLRFVTLWLKIKLPFSTILQDGSSTGVADLWGEGVASSFRMSSISTNSHFHIHLC